VPDRDLAPKETAQQNQNPIKEAVMTHRFHTATLAGIMAVALAAPAFAQGAYSTLPMPENDGMRYQQANLQPKQEGDVTYITGGIGDSEVDQLKSESVNYNFQMINSDPTGHYTADTNLVIQSKDGREMVRVDNAGPLFYAKLPPGEYTVDATNGAQHETKTVRVAASGHSEMHLIWR
jgi:hypothetical protein